MSDSRVSHHRWSLGGLSGLAVGETVLVLLVFFAYAGSPPPAVNEAHYLVLAKNFWQPQWCSGDLFVTSAKPHIVFHATFGALTQFFSLPVATWIARWIGWAMLAVALRSLCRTVSDRDYACVLVAVIWIAAVEWFNFAGEWVVGGIEAKVPAYALVLTAMTAMAQGKWRWVWPLLGAASAFHVLVGGWTVVAALFAYAIVGRRESAPLRQLLPLMIGGTIALLGLVPGLQTSGATDPADTIAAAKIYTYSRISHHLLPSSFPSLWYIRHATIVMFTLLLGWSFRNDRQLSPILWLAAGCGGVALAGLLVGQLPAYWPTVAARLLRYYWFRATDAMMPLTLALTVAAMLRTPAWMGRPQLNATEQVGVSIYSSWLRLAQQATVSVVAGVAIILVSMSMIDNFRRGIPASARFDVVTSKGKESYQAQQQAFRDWIVVCNWIDRTLPADEILITPRHQQSFKWYAQRAEVANWKDVPQDARSLVQWHKRFFDIYPRRLGTVRTTIRYDELRRFREQYGVRLMVVDRRVVGDSLPLVRVYPAQGQAEHNATYAIYRLP